MLAKLSCTFVCLFKWCTTFYVLWCFYFHGATCNVLLLCMVLMSNCSFVCVCDYTCRWHSAERKWGGSNFLPSAKQLVPLNRVDSSAVINSGSLLCLHIICAERPKTKRGTFEVSAFSQVCLTVLQGVASGCICSFKIPCSFLDLLWFCLIWFWLRTLHIVYRICIFYKQQVSV